MRRLLLPGRPGCYGDLTERRRDLELMVQPGHRAGLSYLDRQLVPVLGIRDAAGRGRHRNAEPRRSRHGQLARLASDAGIRVRLHRRRSAQPEDHLLGRAGRGGGEDHVSERAVDQHQPEPGHEPRAEESWQPADGLVGDESARAAARIPVSHVDHRRRRALEEDQSGPRLSQRRDTAAEKCRARGTGGRCGNSGCARTRVDRVVL